MQPICAQIDGLAAQAGFRRGFTGLVVVAALPLSMGTVKTHTAASLGGQPTAWLRFHASPSNGCRFTQLFTRAF